jgi:futalosine hydrolase
MTKPTEVANHPKWLVLIPTELERTCVVDVLRIPNSVVEICGFGPVVPAARTVQLIHEHRPDRVLLIGIAGNYDLMLEVGTAFSFSQVACYGVGVGHGETFQTAQEMGWHHWPDDNENRAIVDLIPLAPLTSIASQILTVCSASENQEDVQLRLKKFPSALAEDMEGFAVAAACRICDVPVSIVRGFSNRAGDRDKSNWKIADALSAAVELCHDRIEH